MRDLHDIAEHMERMHNADYRTLLTDLGDVALKFIDAATPVISGTLVRGNSFEVFGDSVVVFGNDVEYAAAVHNGSRPHIILPKSPNGVLRFQVDGQTVFTRQVNHPGNAPNPFIEIGLENAVPALEGAGMHYAETLLQRTL